MYISIEPYRSEWQVVLLSGRDLEHDHNIYVGPYDCCEVICKAYQKVGYHRLQHHEKPTRYKKLEDWYRDFERFHRVY